MTGEIEFELVSGRVAVVTINRESAGNSIDGPARDQLNAVWAEVRAREDIWSVVLTGAGQRFFCTGLDLKWSLARGDAIASDPRWPDLVEIWKPVILAVNGVCSGGGNHFIYQSDFAIGSTNARFLEPHVSVGFVPVREALGLATRIPFGAAARMAMMGSAEQVSASDALRLGLITEITEPPALLERAVDVCRKVNLQSPAAVRATKEILHKARGLMYEGYQTLKWADGVRQQVHTGPDFLEGQRAFVEKRKPRWQGGDI